MRAVVLKDGKLSLDDIPEPVPGPGEVLVKVLACGICGSDKSCAVHGPDFNRASQAAFGVDMLDLDQPIVLGHEFVAEVLSYGPETQRTVPVGTRVVAMPILLREQQVMLGLAGTATPGGYAERMVLTEALLIPVPDGLDTETAALTEPLAVALRSLGRVDAGGEDVPLVVGCGPIGLAVITLLKARGLGPIVAADLSPERREFARRLGADIVVDPRERSPYEAWTGAAVTDDPARMAPPTAVAGQLPLRPTIGFECTGAPGVLQQLISGAPAGSRIAVAGINLGSDTIEPAQAIVKELDLRFSLYYSPQEFAQTLTMLAEGELDATALITGRTGLAGVADAFERLSDSPADAKILIDPSK
ncbi:zinc-binding dehydrogenase [Streptomyces sp. NPDC102360]|uniref:zinc-binding dehydrogenase n=1 Tax=Streptomyces sp. NPDC102360 TaxID=3366160 RepID=UPI0037FDF917